MQGAGKPNSKHLRPVPRLVAQGRFAPPWVRKMWPGCGGLYMPTSVAAEANTTVNQVLAVKPASGGASGMGRLRGSLPGGW